MTTVEAAGLAKVDPVEPVRERDLSRGIVIPREKFDAVLEELDWTWHQVAREEFPQPFTSLEEFQMAIICDDPLLWCQAFLREPEDPDHQAPYNFFDYQVDSLRSTAARFTNAG